MAMHPEFGEYKETQVGSERDRYHGRGEGLPHGLRPRPARRQWPTALMGLAGLGGGPRNRDSSSS